MALPMTGMMGGGGGLGALLARFAAPGMAGQVNGVPMAQSIANGVSPGFWQQFAQMYGQGGQPQAAQTGAPAVHGSSNPFTDKMGQGAQMATAYLDNLENRAGRLGEMLRGPTMPFMPKLNTSAVGPNVNPGQVGLAALLAQIATRRG